MADLIDRDALLKDLRSECPESDVCISGEACIDCIVKRQPAVNRWIPCSEMLPEVDIPVLIYDKHHKAFFVAKLDEDYFGFSSNMWHHPGDVPFWMPLPEPPEAR